MPVIYTCVYIFLGYLYCCMCSDFLSDAAKLAKKHDYGLFKRWAPDFISFGIFAAYIWLALYHLSSLDWDFVNR